MYLTLLKPISYDIKYLTVKVYPYNWCGGIVNGVTDTFGILMPLIVHKPWKFWKIKIDIDTGKIIGWPNGIEATVRYNVSDAGTYTLLDKDNRITLTLEDYAPSILCPAGYGYGEYIMMHIGSNGIIKDWDITKLAEFIEMSVDTEKRC